MSPVRACVVLLALLPACLDFPEGTSYSCTAGTASTDCPGGWSCVGERCLTQAQADHAGACRAACDQFYGCGAAEVCQGDETCTVQFLHEQDADACTGACTSNGEGFTDAVLNCIGDLGCADPYATCDGA